MTASTSLAARAVAAGPPTLAPPSFEGHNWLYVLNLFYFLAGTELCGMLFFKMATDTVLCWLAPADVPSGERWYGRVALAGRFPSWRPWRVAVLSFVLRWIGPAKTPDHDDWKSPIMLHRRIGMLWSGGFAIRCFSEMQSLWRWYPLDPVGTGRGLALKRVLDPAAASLGFVGLILFFLSLPGITEQLRKEPFPVDMWTSLPLLKRPLGVCVCCLLASIAVVVFR